MVHGDHGEEARVEHVATQETELQEMIPVATQQNGESLDATTAVLRYLACITHCIFYSFSQGEFHTSIRDHVEIFGLKSALKYKNSPKMCCRYLVEI
jgi:hypothetical protein